MIIDGCKREYEIDGMEEIKRIQSLKCMNRYRMNENGKKEKFDFPEFMKYTRPIQMTKNGKALPFSEVKKSKSKLVNRIDKSLKCPMNDLQYYLDRIQNMSTSDAIPTEHFFIKYDGDIHTRSTKKMISLIKNYTNNLNTIRSSYNNNKELYQYEIEELTRDIISKFKKYKFKNKKTINRLIEIALCIVKDENTNIKIESKYNLNVLNILYRTNPKLFLEKNFIKNAKI